MMKRKTIWAFVIGFLVLGWGGTSGAETKKEYQSCFRVMLDYAVRMNDHIRRNLNDRSLSSYAHAMAEVNASQAEQMTPPRQYTRLHPHFLLVLENVERSFFFASKGDMAKYRRYQKIVRKEVNLLEALAEQEHLELYIWGRRY